MSREKDELWERAAELYRRKDYAAAFPLYLGLAEDFGDHGELVLFVGHLYYFGRGTQKDEDEAVRWFRRAAELGVLKARLWLAGIYIAKGQRLAAREELEEAANLGWAPAMYYLGKMYELGLGVPVDPERASDYFQAAAQRGHVFAERQLALSLMRGHGLRGLFAGLKRFALNMIVATKIHWTDPKSDRLLV